ncbi:MAG: cadmium-translocating P-type ATPase [Clostridiales bacterium]|jgi:Cd2+/Zn2+-exporting ATPase|nr:cadmium-translocating P-type ATPase [Clostridiales bacterium]
MSKTTKRLLRIITGGALLITGLILNPVDTWLQLCIFIAAYLAAGGDVLFKALRNITCGRVFDENFLMSLATAGAFIIGEYPEGIGVMLFYQVGELFQGLAVERSRRSIAGLMDIRPDFANVKRGGVIARSDPEDVRVGDIIIIKAGEKVPLDGIVTDGASALDASAITGEALPKQVFPGSEILSGCVNINGLLTVRVTKEYGESTVSKILDLVENAASKKAETENFITRFARYYTPCVVILAAIISFIPPLITGAALEDWVYRGLTFLVISCPCALVVSVPLGFFGGIGGASRKGILIKGGNYLEALSKLETVVFDKTGTLTQGAFKVREIRPAGMSEAELLELAAYAEGFSNHPISVSIKNAYGKEIDASKITQSEEIPGCGVRVSVCGKTVLAGNAKLMKQKGIECKSEDMRGTTVFVAVDGVFAGSIIIADAVKADAADAIRLLKEAGVTRTVMLTGDANSAGEAAAAELGIDAVYAELLPADKVEKLEELLKEKSAKGKLAYAGDGINDAPVLARADVGIAMGGLGSDAAIEAADVVIMTDEPSKIAWGIRIARRTLGIIKQNIVFSLAVKLAVLVLAALGAASMWAGVAADVGVTVLAVLNAARTLKV